MTRWHSTFSHIRFSGQLGNKVCFVSALVLRVCNSWTLQIIVKLWIFWECSVISQHIVTGVYRCDAKHHEDMGPYYRRLAPNSWTLTWIHISIAVITASTLLEKFSTWPLSGAVWIWGHSVRSGNGVGWEDLRYSSSQRCSLGWRSGFCAGRLSSPTHISLNHVFMEQALCTDEVQHWNRSRPSQNWPLNHTPRMLYFSTTFYWSTIYSRT